MRKTKRIGVIVLVNIIVLLALSLVGEVALRAYVRMTRGSLGLQMDDLLGWKTKENYRFRGNRTSAAGDEYEVIITTNEKGFRQWDKPSAGTKKIFVIGDSFTHAMNASDHKTYYASLGRELGWRVYAYGSSGYGTTQEYLVLERYLEEISPDVVLLQFSSNDFVNNHYEYERTRVTNGFTRPYLEEGRIVYRMPRPGRWLRETGNRYSYLVYFACTRYDNIVRKYGWGGQEGDEDRLKNEAEDVTRRILNRFRERCSNTRLVAFCIAGNAEEEAQLVSFLSDEGIEVIPHMTRLIEENDGDTLAMRAGDRSHLNEKGHMTLGKGLTEWFRNN